MNVLRYCLLAALTLIKIGCMAKPDQGQVYDRVTTPTLTADQPLPAALGKPMLTVTGQINVANSGTQIVMDRALTDIASAAIGGRHC